MTDGTIEKGDPFLEAFETRDIEQFVKLIFPPTWQGIAARIVETGVTFSTNPKDPWAPRWSKIPPTVRECKLYPPVSQATGAIQAKNLETAIKSCIFRVHDCIHQLWGLPLPSERLDEADFFEYKRAQMCGEVAVLTLTEFAFADYWYRERKEEEEGGIFWDRNALPMLYGPLTGKSILQVAQRMDDLLHKKSRPRWVREHKASTAFVDDYVPMLEFDRTNIDHNWRLMKAANWRPVGAPNSRYSPGLDGLELTQWMIEDFNHLMDTDEKVDEPLRDFNRKRREGIVLPEGWNGANKP